MQVRKTYYQVNPELLFAEIRDFTVKQGARLVENRLETYTLPDESAVFIVRATLTFTAGNGGNRPDKECLRAHIVGNVRGDTKLMLDADDKLFPAEKFAALQEDIDFIFKSYEERPEL